MCVAPDHLFLGTQQDNMIDMRSKNRGYSTKGENHGLSKLTLENVREIRQSHASGNISLTALALKFGVSVSTIHSIVNNNSWRNL
jgi:DNA invertase Pin-like site-specific DNA recombinase